MAPLDFHTWYKYKLVDRGLKVLFLAFFAIFWSFFFVTLFPP